MDHQVPRMRGRGAARRRTPRAPSRCRWTPSGWPTLVLASAGRLTRNHQRIRDRPRAPGTLLAKRCLSCDAASGRQGSFGSSADGKAAWKTWSFSWPGFGTMPPPEVWAWVNVWTYRAMSSTVMPLARNSSWFMKTPAGCTVSTIGTSGPLVSNWLSMAACTAEVEISNPPETAGFGIAAWSAVTTIAHWSRSRPGG